MFGDKMKIEYIPSAYLICCDKGHDIKLFGDVYICSVCGLRIDQIQRLTIGDEFPRAIFKSEPE